MGASPTYHLPEGEECETSVEHGLPLWAEPAVGHCSRRPCPFLMWGSNFVGARAVGPCVGEQKRLGKTPLGGNPSPEMTYLPTCLRGALRGRASSGFAGGPPGQGWPVRGRHRLWPDAHCQGLWWGEGVPGVPRCLPISG